MKFPQNWPPKEGTLSEELNRRHKLIMDKIVPFAKAMISCGNKEEAISCPNCEDAFLLRIGERDGISGQCANLEGCNLNFIGIECSA